MRHVVRPDAIVCTKQAFNLITHFEGCTVVLHRCVCQRPTMTEAERGGRKCQRLQRRTARAAKTQAKTQASVCNVAWLLTLFKCLCLTLLGTAKEGPTLLLSCTVSKAATSTDSLSASNCARCGSRPCARRGRRNAGVEECPVCKAGAGGSATKLLG